jgi:integrase
MSTSKRRSDGAGSVYQRADGRWVAQVRIHDEHTGQSRKVRRYASNRDAARELLKDLKVAQPQPAARGDMTVVEYLSHWAATSLPVSGRSPATVDNYRNMVRSPLTPTLGAVRLSRFTAAEAERWLARLDAFTKKDGRPLSASTKRTSYATLAAAMDVAVRDDLLPANPVRKVRRPSPTRQAVPVLSAEEVETLLDVSQGARVGGLVTFVAFTGVRLGEALSLRWTDVDLERGTALLQRGSLERQSTKTGTIRSVPLVPEVVTALRAERAWQAEHRLILGKGWADTGLVFTTALGTPVDPHNARRDLRALLKKAGLPTDRAWHTLRHSLATRLLNRGTPMPVVSAILGHSSIRTTVDVYGHHEPAVSADALAKALAQ